MDAIKDLWASLVAGIRDRTTNPLTVAFVVSWCLWNYKFFVVLLGDGSTAERLTLVSEMYPNYPDTYLGAALLYPIVSALVYVLLYPVLGMGAIWVYRKYQVTTANLVKNVEKARTITPKERDLLVRTHEKELKMLTDEVEALTTQLSAIRDALATAEDQLSKASSTGPAHEAETKQGAAPLEEKLGREDQRLDQVAMPEALTSHAAPTDNTAGLDKTQTQLLLFISRFTGTISLDSIANTLKMNPTLTNSELRQMEKAGLIGRDSADFWGLTSAGEALAVKLLKEMDKKYPPPRP